MCEIISYPTFYTQAELLSILKFNFRILIGQTFSPTAVCAADNAAPIWNLDHHLEEADGDATASDHRIAIDSRRIRRLHFTSQSLQGRRDGSHRCHPNDRQGDDSDTRIGTRRPLRANRHRERCATPPLQVPLDLYPTLLVRTSSRSQNFRLFRSPSLSLRVCSCTARTTDKRRLRRFACRQNTPSASATYEIHLPGLMM